MKPLKILAVLTFLFLLLFSTPLVLAGPEDSFQVFYGIADVTTPSALVEEDEGQAYAASWFRQLGDTGQWAGQITGCYVNEVNSTNAYIFDVDLLYTFGAKRFGAYIGAGAGLVMPDAVPVAQTVVASNPGSNEDFATGTLITQELPRWTRWNGVIGIELGLNADRTFALGAEYRYGLPMSGDVRDAIVDDSNAYSFFVRFPGVN